MSINLGINGFGRIGRLVFRAAFENKANINIRAVNDPFMDIDYLIYQLKYDSAHLRFPGTIEKIDANTFAVNGKKVKLTNELDPANLKWGSTGCDIVVESTGIFLSQKAAQCHLDGGITAQRNYTNMFYRC